MLKSCLHLCLIFLCYFVCVGNTHAKATFGDRPLVIAINKTSYPYHFENQNGEAAGLTVDLWRLWAEKQNVDIKFNIMTWQETLLQLEAGQVDIHGGLSKTQRRLKRFLFTSPFFHQDSHIFIHRDYHVKTVEEVQPFALGIVKNSSHVDVIKDRYPELMLKYYDSRFALFDAALKGEIVAFTNLDNISNNYPHHREVSQLFPAYKRLLFEQSEYGSAVAKNNGELLAFIEQGMEKITRDERSSIEKKWLGLDKKNDTLALLYSPEFPPFMAVSSSGAPQGLFIDIWRKWSEHTGQAIEFIPQSFENTIELLTTGGADIHIGFPDMSFTQGTFMMYPELRPAIKLYQAQVKCYISKKLTNGVQPVNIKGKRLGILQVAPDIDNLSFLFPDNELVIYQNFQLMIQDAESGKIDGFLGGQNVMESRLSMANVQHDFYSLPSSVAAIDLFAVTALNNEKLAEIVKEGFSLIPDEELIKLERRWLSKDSEGYFKLKAQKAHLDDIEAGWLANHREIKMGINKDWQPVEFLDEKGQVQGINADINAIVEQRTGIKFTYVPFDNWQQMLDGLKHHEIDILGSATETEERKQFMLFSESYWDMPWVVIHRKELGERLRIEDFYGSELAIVKGYYLIDKIREEHPNITLRIVDSHEEGLLAVQRGVVQGFIENIASASELIRRESLITLSMSVVEDLNIDKNSYAIRKDWPELQSIVNKALATINASERKKIYEHWFEINLETGLDRSVVMRVSLQIGAIIVIVIVVIVLWNRRLYVEVETRKALEEKMKHMAMHDELTGLPNRLLLKDRINHGISHHRRQDRLMAVLFIDLDGFKSINDTFGHDVGDELLKQVAERLSGCVRQSDTVVRFGGDEFILLLTGLHNKNEAAFIAEKVLKLVQQPFELSVGEECIGCSIGIAMFPTDGESESDLLKVADTLMYKVKAAGKNHYVFNTDN